MSLWFLFFSAFISSTLFSGGSEAVLAYLSTEEKHSNGAGCCYKLTLYLFDMCTICAYT